jgi:hypothetical protein
MQKSLSLCLHEKPSMANMSDMAKRIAERRGIRIDRIARRTKEGMICWFCENAPELAFGVVPPCHFRRKVPPPAYAGVVPTVADVPRSAMAMGRPIAIPPPTVEDIFECAGQEATTDEENENPDNWNLEV